MTPYYERGWITMHHHICSVCKTVKVPCDGTWERNEDGWPEVLCDLHHRFNVECICDACRARIAADLEAQEREETPWAV